MSIYIDKTLPELREIADELGLEYMKNISAKRLIELLEADDAAAEGTPTPTVKKVKALTPAEIRKSMDKLVRCRVSSSDPMYHGRNGVTLQIVNKYKTVGKFIPFDTVWHMPEPIHEALKRRTWRETKFITDKVTGNKVPKTTMRPSFVIELLPDLTEKELKALASEQAARGSLDDD